MTQSDAARAAGRNAAFKLMQEDVSKRYDAQLGIYKHLMESLNTQRAPGMAAGMTPAEVTAWKAGELQVDSDGKVLGNQEKRVNVLRGVQELGQQGRWAPKPDKAARVVNLGGREWIEDANGNLRPAAEEAAATPEFITDPVTGQRYARYGKELTQQRIPGDEPSKAEYDMLNEYSMLKARAAREPGNKDYAAQVQSSAEAFRNLFGRLPDEPRRRAGEPAKEAAPAAPKVEAGAGKKLYEIKADEKTGAAQVLPSGGTWSVASLRQARDDGKISQEQALAILENLKKAGLVKVGGAK